MNAWTRRIAVIAAVVAVGSLISMAPASAANTPITITPESVAQGGTFTVSGPADCIIGTLSIHADLGLNALTPQSVSGAAAWEVTFTVPADAALGSYTASVQGNECSFGTAVVLITAAVPTTTAAPTTTMAPTTTAPPAKIAAVTATPAFTG